MDDAIIQEIANIVVDLISMFLPVQQALALLSDPSAEPEALHAVLSAVLSKDPDSSKNLLRGPIGFVARRPDPS